MSFTSTDAKTVVLHFYTVTGNVISKADISRQTATAKKLLEDYSVDEIKEVINMLNAQGKKITSLGYLPYVIVEFVKTIRSKQAEKAVQQMKAPTPQDVITNNNNKDKVKNFGVKKDWGGWDV